MTKTRPMNRGGTMSNKQHDNVVARPADDEARCRAIDPEGSFIVRAPAGSGKTTLLIQRYLVLLTRVERPEEILCMTFTRKAAGEMRSRVVRALQCAEDGTSDRDTKTHDLACAALAHAQKRGWNLLQNPSRLQFYTIDGLCHWLVRQMPHASGLGALPDLEELSVMLCRRAAAKAIARMDDGEDPAAEAARIVLGYLDNNYDRLQKLIVEMLERRDQWLELTTLPNDAGTREALETIWSEIVIGDLARLRKAMSSQAPFAEDVTACAAAAAQWLYGEGSDSPIAACRDLTNLPPASVDALPQWRGLAELLLTKPGLFRKSGGVTKAIGFPTGNQEKTAAKQRMKDVLEGVGEGPVSWIDDLRAVRVLPCPRYDDQQWRVLGALLVLLKQAAAQLNLDIGGFGRCDYIAVSSCARAALGEVDNPTDLALALDYRISHILVDEFQDTSQSQMRLLELLIAGWDGSDQRTLFLVGDPMQSIYAFRRADVSIYLRVAKEGMGQLELKTLTLTANFRSQRPLVDWVNRVFRDAMPQHPDVLSGAVVFAESSVVHDDADEENRAGVHYHAYLKPKPDKQDKQVRDKLYEAEGFGFADVVRQEWHAHPNATIAVLARSRSHLPDILHALKKAGVPYQEIGLELLARRPLGQDLLALTRALLHPADRTAWLAVLRAPWCGLELRDLDVVCNASGDLWPTLCRHATLDGLSATARERLARVMPVLERALAQRGRLMPARWIENVWLQLGGAAVVSGDDWPDALLYFNELHQRCEASGLRAYDELDACLETLYVTGSGDRGGQENPVQVMTMHGAKGLEFDVVLIPGLGRGLHPDTKKIMAWNDHLDSGTEQRVLMAPLPVSDNESGGAMYAYLKMLEKNRNWLETARLLYVACTRAKRRLHLFAIVKNAKDAKKVEPLTNESLLSHIWDSCEEDFRKAQKDVEQPDPSPPSVEQQTRLLRVPDGWHPPAPAVHVPTLQGPDDVPDADTPSPTFDWAGQPARLTGIIVHRMLCLIAKQGLHVWNVERVRGCRVAWTAELEVQGLEPATIERALGDIERALRFSLDDPKGRWILDDTHRDARNEYDISGIVNGRPVRKVLDRTMTDADGVRWIIDYKAGVHRGADLDLFLDNERERYRSQLDGYAAMVSRMTNDPIRLGLYFPLARGWREWAWQGDGERS